MATLIGDWRRRRGTKTDAHLYRGTGHHPFDQRPMCGKAIRHISTVPIKPWTGKPISRSDEHRALAHTECLIAALTEPRRV